MAKKKYEGLYESYHFKMLAILAGELECSQNEVLRQALEELFIRRYGNKTFRELVKSGGQNG